MNWNKEALQEGNREVKVLNYCAVLTLYTYVPVFVWLHMKIIGM